MKCRKVNGPCATPASDGDLRHVDGTKQGVVGMVHLLGTTKDLDCWLPMILFNFPVVVAL